MDALFEDTQGGFSIRYYERLEVSGDNAKFKVTVRHGEDVGSQDGKTFNYKSFLNTFDDLELRALNSNNGFFWKQIWKWRKKV